jgi:membrane-bound metal-dependent hydrolase YbcI (DUF457 family)
MDNLTHGLAGALLAQAGFRQHYGRAATVALVVGAELPDLDFLFDLAGPVAGFQHHRGITHSFVGGAGLALFGAAFLYTALRYRTYWRLVGLVYLGVLLHIWMDYLTPYGTQVLLPFAAGRYSADAVFIIDYFYTGILVVALLAIRMVRGRTHERYLTGSLLGMLAGGVLWYTAPWFVQQPLLLLAVSSFGTHLLGFAAVLALLAVLGRHWAPGHDRALGRYGMAGLAAYMALCIVGQAVATHRFSSSPALQQAAVRHVSAIPLPGGFLYWRGIADTPTAYLVSNITLFPRAVSSLEVIPKGLEHTLVQATSAYRLVQVFQDFARFPVAEYRQLGVEQIVRYFDLRFTGSGREKGWFDLEVYFDGGGRVLEIRFLNHVFPPYHPDF